ncbi:hypothetical protein H4J57_00395 [Colwellia sp. BRX8-7]|uniref:O-antigen ligase family protein n=1 Tax=Colwellia sp. BRX8-7 TaxID=2759833 RepID=UPI0015F3BE79|nr:O-antigen ligase family protein [Colwellia sp. BRX8-7]MBA6335657.1 hypothetical protein [Colwellia sp. BRX8-7]
MKIFPSKISVIFVVVTLVYSQFLLGMLSDKIIGISLIPIISLVVALVFLSKTKVFTKEIIIFVLLVNSFFIFSFMVSDKGEYATYKFIFIILKFTVYVLLGALFGQKKELFAPAVFNILLIFFIYSMFFCFVNQSTFDVNNRVFIGIFNPIWIGRIIFEFFLISLFFLNKKLWVNILIFTGCLFITYMTGSKGALFSLILTVFYWYYANEKINKFYFTLTLLFFILFCFLIYTNVDVDSYVFQRFMTTVPDGTSDELYNESRIIVWPKTFELIVSQDLIPLLFGNGIGEFGSFYKGHEYNARFYPHNLILELIVEFGLIFTTAVFIYMVKIFKKSKSLYKLLFLYFLLNSMFSGDILLNEFLYLYMGCLMSKKVTLNNNYNFLRPVKIKSNLKFQNLIRTRP